MCTRPDTSQYYYNEYAHKHITVRGVSDLLDNEMVLLPLYTPIYWQIAFYMRNGNEEHACPLHIDGAHFSHIVKSFFQLEWARSIPPGETPLGVCLNIPRHLVPRQNDATSCGVFVCLYATLKVNRIPLNQFH